MNADLSKEAPRYNCSGYCYGMEAEHGGAWVSATDYDVLRAEIKAMADRATAAMEGAVRVRGLEWSGEFQNEAQTPFCSYVVSYVVTEVEDARWQWSRSEYPYHWTSDPDYGTEDAAKAAAQADYERRILAALEPNPAAQDREALIEALTARATAAEAALATAMAGAVRVKPLEWFEVARGNNGYGKWEAEGYVVQKIEGLFLINFAGSYKNEWRFTSVGSAKAAAEADYNRRILAALEPNPAAQDREAALIADGHGVYLTHAELAARDGALIVATLSDIDLIEQCISDVFREGGTDREAASHVAAALATQPQTDALEAVRREARAEGMRMAADLFTGSDLWEEAGIREWILAAAQTAADSVMGRA